MITEKNQKRPNPKNFGVIKPKTFSGGKIEAYGTNHLDSNNCFYSINLFPEERGFQLLYEKERNPKEIEKSDYRLCNRKTREMIKFDGEKGIVEEWSCDYDGYADENRVFKPTERREKADYLRSLVPYILNLEKFKKIINTDQLAVLSNICGCDKNISDLELSIAKFHAIL